MDSNSRILPIFPLPLVQFPATATPLHIFEERYRKMLRDIMLTDKTFGITYHSLEPETGPETGLDEPLVGSVGCAVEVVKLEPLTDGRANILCAGVQRYHLLDYVEGEPYLQAEVEFFDDEPMGEDLTLEMERASDLFKRVLAASRHLQHLEMTEQAEAIELPDDAAAVSFIIAAGLDLETAEKQALLELTETGARLRRVTAQLEELVRTYERRAQAHQLAKRNGHGGKSPF